MDSKDLYQHLNAEPTIGLNQQGVIPEATQMPQADNMDLQDEVDKKIIGRPAIGKDEIAKGIELLTKYKDGKANLERRIVEDELWWELRHWEVIRRQKANIEAERFITPEPTSGWLFNSIVNKHADAMDNYPEPIVLPRERSDKESAKMLSDILPVVLEHNDFENVYSQNWWEKLKHGTGCYGVFWNSTKDNGIGDIDIKSIDLLKIFYEPGITDIQKSRNLFIVDLIDEDLLDQMYPEHKGKMGGSVIDVKQYIFDDSVDTTDKSLVVDWYYKKRDASGRTILHYVKFVGDELLYASENDPEYMDRGFYDHGQYPIVMDSLFPEKGTPVGFGYISVCKDPQLYIDKLSANILESSMMSSKKRYFVSENTAINEQEFNDWSKTLVHVAGEISDARLQEINVSGVDGNVINVLQMKIEEMKDTSSNRDVNSGGTSSGVNAAAAISALQEAGNKASRDMIAASYRAYNEISTLCVELIRQFYDEVRSFRITGQMPGEFGFMEFSNAGIKDQPMGIGMNNEELFRKPVFDVKIRAQKRNPFKQVEENQRALEMYAAGFFNPEKAQEAMGALEMMDFEQIDDVKAYVQQGQTLLNVLQQMMAQQQQMMASMGMAPQMPGGQPGPAGPQQEGRDRVGVGRESTGANRLRNINQAATGEANRTPYAQRLADKAKPDMNNTPV